VAALIGQWQNQINKLVFSKITDDDGDHLSLAFDFPGLVAPVYAILIKDRDGDGYSAYWSRSKKVVFK